MAMEEKVTAEWISPDRIDDTGDVKIISLFSGAGLLLLMAAIAAMGFAMHFLPGHS